MDPNETLLRIRELVAAEAFAEKLTEEESSELAQLIAALDGWISKGGFLPNDWQRNQKTNKHT